MPFYQQTGSCSFASGVCEARFLPAILFPAVEKFRANFAGITARIFHRARAFVVCAALDDPAVIKYQDLVRTHNRGKPMRDDNRCAVRHQTLQRFLDQSLRRGVHTRGRFIENQNRWIFQQRRAMESRCFSPTLNLTPRSPTTLSKPSGKR
jgi:hypothetical protein